MPDRNRGISRIDTIELDLSSHLFLPYFLDTTFHQICVAHVDSETRSDLFICLQQDSVIMLTHQSANNKRICTWIYIVRHKKKDNHWQLRKKNGSSGRSFCVIPQEKSSSFIYSFFFSLRCSFPDGDNGTESKHFVRSFLRVVSLFSCSGIFGRLVSGVQVSSQLKKIISLNGSAFFCMWLHSR